MKKRLWAILLAVCMVITMVPITALAAEDGVKTEDELRAAIDAATGTESAPTVIRLSESIEINSSIVIPDGKYIELVGESGGIVISPSSTFQSTLFAPALIGIGHAENSISNATTTLTLRNIILDGKNVTRCIAIHKGNYLATQAVILRNGATGSASSGGGIAVCWHGESEKAHLSLTETEIHNCSAGVPDNQSGKYGGAINTYGNADVSMCNVNFHSNYANWGGSAIYEGNLTLSGDIVLGKDDTGNGVYDANIVVSGPLGDSSEIYIGTPSSRQTIATAGEGYTITQSDLQKFHLKFVSHNNTNVADQYTIYLDKAANAIKLAKATTVTFHANDDTPTDEITQKVPKNIASALALNSFTRSGYTFTGWNTAADGAGTAYTNGQEVTLTDDLTLYAQWRERQLSEITAAPKENAKFTYGSTLKSSDFVVTEVYDNGETVTVDSTNYTVSPAVLETVGESVPVTVTYQDQPYSCTIKVDKSPQTAPAAPTLKTSDYTGITLNTVEANANGAKAQYRCNDGAWQDSPEFTGLTAGTVYTFAVRYAETDTYAASEDSDTAEFSTLRYFPASSGSSTGGPVTVSGAKNGDVTVSPKTAKKGDTVTVTVTPDKGYTLETLTVLDKNGSELKLTDKGNGQYTFIMPDGKVEVRATFMDDNTMLNYFVDVKADDYFYDAVLWAVKNGITKGVSDTDFGPELACTRAQIVTFLWRAAGSPEPKNAGSFADVSADSYYAKAVAWAVENDITGGTGDGQFSPDAACTREQAVAFLYRASGSPAVSGGSAFGDVAADAYYANAVAWAEKNGVTGGIGGGLFGSGNDCTRAQIVTFLYRTYQGK